MAEVSSIHSMQGQPFFVDRSHDYSDPDEPNDVQASGRYNHLAPNEVEVHPERHSQAFSDLEGLKDETDAHVVYTRGYVPTKVGWKMVTPSGHRLQIINFTLYRTQSMNN